MSAADERARDVLAQLRDAPLETQVAVKQGLEPVGHLDHPRYDIKLGCDTDVELFRLGSCAKEPETVAWIERTFRPGDVLYDVGANVGAYSFLAAEHGGPESAVYAFEPTFSTYAGLARNVILNGAEGRVVPLNVALDSETGFAPLSFSSLRAGGAMHTFGERPEGEGAWQPVLAFRLDDLVEQFALRPPTHLKLDVDGAELPMLQGAPATIRSAGLRTVLVEVTESQPDAEPIVRLLADAGFRETARHLHERSGVTNVILERA